MNVLFSPFDVPAARLYTPVESPASGNLLAVRRPRPHPHSPTPTYCPFETRLRVSLRQDVLIEPDHP